VLACLSKVADDHMCDLMFITCLFITGIQIFYIQDLLILYYFSGELVLMRLLLVDALKRGWPRIVLCASNFL
jgi:hypothetical protein